jgi:uncharacterized repeat protein (TIGR03803 family)
MSLNTLAGFNGTNGANPVSGLIADAHGDLFGTTQFGGTNNLGSVFEIPKEGSHGALPQSDIDAASAPGLRRGPQQTGDGGR